MTDELVKVTQDDCDCVHKVFVQVNGNYGNAPKTIAKYRIAAVKAERERIAEFVRAWNGDTRDGDTFNIANAIEGGQE